MKKLLAILSSLIIPLVGVAADSVMVDTNGLVQFPVHFFTINGVSTTNTTTGLDARITVLESQLPVTSNDLSGRIDAATNDIATLNGEMTNTASLAMGIAGTNALAIATTLANSPTYTNAIPYTNGTVYAAFVGNGSGLTGIISSVTGGVNSVTAGGSNFTGNIVLNGTGFGYGGPGTITVTRIEYITKDIALSTNVYEQSLEGPRDENATITKIFAKSDAYNATFNVISYPTNTAWRDNITTNLAGIVAVPTGIWVTNQILIQAGYEWGTQVSDYDPRTTQIRVMYKVTYQ